MSFPAILVLEDGTVIEGTGFGATKPSVGEIVFNTSMSGYQEIITDPSYAKQIIAFTHPILEIPELMMRTMNLIAFLLLESSLKTYPIILVIGEQRNLSIPSLNQRKPLEFPILILEN